MEGDPGVDWGPIANRCAASAVRFDSDTFLPGRSTRTAPGPVSKTVRVRASGMGLDTSAFLYFASLMNVRWRWQFAHTTSHLAISASSASIDGA